MTHSHLRRNFVLAALLAGAAAACTDPPPAPPKIEFGKRADPLAGAPIDGTPAAAPATASAAPVVPPIGDLSTAEERSPEDQPLPPSMTGKPPLATEPPVSTVPGPTVPGPTGAEPPVAEPPTARAPAEPAPTPPATVPVDPPTSPVERPPAPVAPTTAQQQAKPDLPTKAGEPADPSAAPAPKGERVSLVPKGHKKGEPIVLTWEQLASFDFTPPPPVYPDPETGVVPDQTAAIEAAKKQIPEEIWELEGHTIAVEGYMIPLEYAEEGVKAFLLSRHAMGCCFGVLPRAHELLECDMGEKKPVAYIGYMPVTITGVMQVGIKEGPQTVLSGIYRMTAPKLTVPKDDE